jgi:hypothetical protein
LECQPELAVGLCSGRRQGQWFHHNGDGGGSFIGGAGIVRGARCSNCERLASAAFNGVTLKLVKSQTTERTENNLAERRVKFMIDER